MITVGMYYEVLEGKEKIFETAFRNVTNALEKAEGHDRSRLYQDVTSSSSYLIVSEWLDAEAFHAFIGSETFRKVTDWGREKILARRPEHHVYGEGAGIERENQ